MNPLLLTLLVGFFILGGTLLGFCTKNNKKIIKIINGEKISNITDKIDSSSWSNLKVLAFSPFI